MTKSELLRQLQKHKEDPSVQKDGEIPKISFSNIISDEVVRSATAIVSTRPVHQIQSAKGSDNDHGQENITYLRKRLVEN